MMRHPSGCPESLYRLVPLDSIPCAIARFYKEDEEHARRYVACQPERAAYMNGQTASVIIICCIDEREHDTCRMLGFPLGVANLVQIAGCCTDDRNLSLAQYVQQKVKLAASVGKLLLILIITHQSEVFQSTDSCAQWHHDVLKADAHATELVASYNAYGGDSDPDGRIAVRYRLAVHLKSFTDTEARVWVGLDGVQVTPMDFVAVPGKPAPHGSKLHGAALSACVEGRFFTAFPEDDSRFEGISHVQYLGLILQMSEMCVQNINGIRRKLSRPLHVVKSGHRGTRILIGRGWDMYVEADKYFRVSDLISYEQLVEQFRNAARFVVRNKLKDGRQRLVIPIHVNGLYNHGEEGDRSGTIQYVVGMARAIQGYLRTMCDDPEQRRLFDVEVKDALAQAGMKWTSLTTKARRNFHNHLFESFQVYVSVSKRSTRELELVAAMSYSS